MPHRPMHLTDIAPLFIIDAILLPVCRSLYNLSNNELSSVSYRLHSQPRTEFIICSISTSVCYIQIQCCVNCNMLIQCTYVCTCVMYSCTFVDRGRRAGAGNCPTGAGTARQERERSVDSYARPSDHLTKAKLTIYSITVPREETPSSIYSGSAITEGIRPIPIPHGSELLQVAARHSSLSTLHCSISLADCESCEPHHRPLTAVFQLLNNFKIRRVTYGLLCLRTHPHIYRTASDHTVKPRKWRSYKLPSDLSALTPCILLYVLHT